MSTHRSVAVSGLLSGRAEAVGLPLELLGGTSGLDRPITSPHIQKTGLALAGFDEYLQPNRILVFAESGMLVGFFLPGDSLVFIAGWLWSPERSVEPAAGDPSMEASLDVSAAEARVARQALNATPIAPPPPPAPLPEPAPEDSVPPPQPIISTSRAWACIRKKYMAWM